MSDNVKEIILVVDDEPINLMIAQKLLSTDYKVAAANSAAAALRYLEKNRPNLILMDIKMPEMDGFETVAAIKRQEELSAIPIIFLTADNDSATEEKCFRSGAVDFVGKPFVSEILLSRIKRTLELERYKVHLEEMVEAQSRELVAKTEKMNQIQNSIIVGMANIIEYRDSDTGFHVKHTQNYVDFIVNKLYWDHVFPELEDDEYRANICRAAVLHDIGKIKIPDSVLLKPGRLTDEEYAIMKQHTVYGSQIIKDVISDIEDDSYIKTAIEIALHHHEFYNGNGYPMGLKGEEIPLSARIMAVADVFDALYEERCYKKPMRPIEKIFDILEEEKGTHFDAKVVDAFIELKPTILEYLEQQEAMEA